MNIFKQYVNWKTTIYDGDLLRRINEIITLNLRIACKQIIKIIPRVISIYLTRSFSRGEGSVLIHNNDVKILSDLDLLVISESPQFMLTLSLRHMDNIPASRFHNVEIMQGHPIVEIEVMNKNTIKKIPPSLFSYDLKTAKCIYGSDILKYVLKKSREPVPLKEGFRLLFDRMFGALIPFRVDFLNSEPSEKKKRHLTFETVKLVSACRDAILILNNVYFPTESQRQRYLRQKWFNELVFFAKELPQFLDLSEKAHKYRLKPNKEFENSALRLWFDSIQICFKVLEIYLNRLFNTQRGLMDNISDLSKRNLYTLNDKLNFLYEYLKEKKIWSRYKTKILVILLLLLLSVEKDGINEEMLERALSVLGLKYSIRSQKNAKQLWNTLKKIVVENYQSPLPRKVPLTTIFNNIIAGTLLTLM